MSTNPGQKPDPSDRYGGYSGYTPHNPADDPYATSGQSQQTGTGYQGNDPNYTYGQPGTQQQQYSTGQQQQYSTGQQQSNTYQPPASVLGSGRTGGLHDSSTLGINPRLAALLSYLVGPFSGIVVFFLERRNQFVRFNAAQSVVVFGPAFIVYLIAQILIKLTAGIFLIGALFGTVFGCLSTVLVIVFGLLGLFLMVQAYRGVKVKLPIAGNYADSFIARFSGRKTI